MSFYIIKTEPNDTRYAYIDGSSGIYDGKIRHPNVKYGRNAISNFENYLEIRSKNLAENIPETDSFVKAEEFSPRFELKYMPRNINYLSINAMALIGAAFQEMGREIFLSKEQLTQTLKNKFKNSVGIEKEEINADILDINKDDKIDVGEYAASILASDMLSRGASEVQLDNIEGNITNDGIRRLSKLFDKKNAKKGERVFNLLHSFFTLDAFKDKFIFDANSTQK